MTNEEIKLIENALCAGCPEKDKGINGDCDWCAVKEILEKLNHYREVEIEKGCSRCD